MNRALWIIQILLALVFLVAGGAKFLVPAEQMTLGMPAWLSISFLHFIGACEMLGAIGLILPGLLHIMPGLTPLAAACLTIIVISATVVTLMGGMIAMALFPLVTAMLAVFVAYGRWRLGAGEYTRLSINYGQGVSERGYDSWSRRSDRR